jgi:hypothetical protein
MSNVAEIEAALFKQVGGGWVFQAPNPWVFGRTSRYLVNETQKAELLGDGGRRLGYPLPPSRNTQVQAARRSGKLDNRRTPGRGVTGEGEGQRCLHDRGLARSVRDGVSPPIHLLPPWRSGRRGRRFRRPRDIGEAHPCNTSINVPSASKMTSGWAKGPILPTVWPRP